MPSVCVHSCFAGSGTFIVNSKSASLLQHTDIILSLHSLRAYQFTEEMPKSKEYVSTDEDSSEEEVKSKKKRQKRETKDKDEKVAKKAKTTESSESEDTVWDLGNNRHVSVRCFKGKWYVDIRELYYDKDANLKPGKKGICLSMPQWQKFVSVVEEVDKAVKSKS